MDESRDNRDLVDHHGNQKLTREDIHSLKDQGASGAVSSCAMCLGPARFFIPTTLQKYRQMLSHVATFHSSVKSTRPGKTLA